MTAKSSSETIDLVRIYLREIGKVPLLTRQEEIDYGTQVQQMMSLLEALKALAKKLHREPTWQEWASHIHTSEAELNQTVRHGQGAKQKMISANLRLVVVIAKKYQNRNLEFLDLIQSGTIGLQRGIEKFDPSKGFKLSTYCYWWIRQAITRAIAQQARMIRLPVHIIEKLNKIKKVQRQLSQRLGRTATIAEVATELRVTPLQVQDYLEQARLTVSLEQRVGENKESELGDLLEDPGTSPEEFAIQSSLSSDLERLMAELKPQQRDVLSLRFGLVDGKPLTLAQIGTRLNLNRERIRQIEQEALTRLRRHRRKLG